MATARTELRNMNERHIMDYFPGEPRPIQREVLETLEREWNNYDVFALILPVATGKSNIAITLANWLYFVDILTPTNLLIQQYLRDFPKFPVAMRRDLFPCCQQWGKRKHVCDYVKQQRMIRAVPRGLMNYYMYMSLGNSGRQQAPNLVIDEAHGVIGTLQDLNGYKMWQHDWHYPNWVRDTKSFLKWIAGRKSVTTIDEKEKEMLQFVDQQLQSSRPQYVFQRTKLDWMRTKEPELRDCILWKPVDISRPDVPLWKRDIQKLVLMSATLSRRDIEALGLHKKRVLLIQGHSPIPKTQRPVILDSVISLNYGNLVPGTEQVANYIHNVLAPRHEGEKGVIHATYQQAELLRKHLKGSRYIFHDRYDKQEKYEQFLKATPESGAILVASGLYEGIDLPGDLGRWQVVAKVPWLSLADPAVKYKADSDRGWYDWETLKVIIQASGRVCRTPQDHGLTYIVDGSIIPLYERNKKQLPEWFTEAVKFDTRR